MNKFIKLILAAAAAAFTFASCSSNDTDTYVPTQPAPVDDGGVYSDK